MKPHYALCFLCLYVFSLFVVEAQLTQSLGWGSAGSPGKRSRSLSQDSCDYNTDILQDILYLIQVGLMIPNILSLFTLGLAQKNLSQARAEPEVWTGLNSDSAQASELSLYPSRGMFTLVARLRLQSARIRIRAQAETSVKRLIVATCHLICFVFNYMF